jgi:hypothetical protein
MAKHSMSTYVSVDQLEDDGDTKAIWNAAAEKLQGQLCGTFTRSWETSNERVTHTPPEGFDKE